MTKKIKVAVLYGGISAEHDISVESAKSVMENFDQKKFAIIPVEISKKGKFPIQKIFWADVVFPVLHGAGGEDGSIQGFCQVLQKPYVGSAVESSALALDKIASKQIFKNLKLPIPSFQFFEKEKWRKNPSQILLKIKPPVFIKPAEGGSSIGITKVKQKSKLKEAIKKAFRYDCRIIVEEAIEDIREIEVAILGNNHLVISLPGEIIPDGEFYSFEAKYRLSSKSVIPAELSENKTNEIQKLAKKAYQALGCRGMARIDFFLEKQSQKVYLNEINTIPGFTDISMYPKLLEASGISYKDLLTKLIQLAWEKK